jgi:hypothetical protein
MSFVTHIWIQLGLGYIVKQIYDKPKMIWWDRVNVGKPQQRMISLGNETLFTWITNTRKGLGVYTKT